MLIAETPGSPMNTSSATKSEAFDISSGKGRTAVDKAMVVLTALITSEVALSLTQLSHHTRLAKATVHRVLAVLLAHGMIVRVGDKYSPGEMVRADRGIDDRFIIPLKHCSTPHLVELHQVTGHTASISVLAGDAPRHVNQVFGHRSPRLPSATPADKFLPRTAIEQVLRAYQIGSGAGRPCLPAADELSEIRRAGLAQVDDPLRKVTSIAVPLSGLQRPVALALTSHLRQVDTTAVARVLRQAAFTLARTLIAHRAVMHLPEQRTATQ